MRFFILYLLFSLLGSGLTCAQTPLNLAGIVTDENGHPLEGAIIIIRGTSKGTVSKANGEFSFRATETLPLAIIVSANGYHQVNATVRGNNFRYIEVQLSPQSVLNDQVVVGVSRKPEDIQNTAQTVEKFGSRYFQESAALSPFDALQNATGVDFTTQSFFFKSINLRGLGSTNNSRFLQLTDGVDNRSPGLGFGFGNVAGIPDLDVDNIELISGASSALYGPDAMQGIMLTTSKDPFIYDGLSARVTTGFNNLGKANFGPKPYTDLSIRYANQFSSRLAAKIVFQRISGTDFIADDYSDRSTNTRTGFFLTDGSRGGIATGIGYIPNTNANINFEYDGVNLYGDDINGGGAFRFPDNYANILLSRKLITRTGYTELDLIGNQGKVFNNRATASLHYKLSDGLEASISWNYGNGNFIRTSNYREYFPNYQRHQIKAELRGSNFFLRAYTTQQNADGWNLGQTATAINNTWKSLNQWAVEFGQAYVETKVTVGLARSEANRGRYLPGTSQFNTIRDAYANTYNTNFLSGSTTARGRRFQDNSQLWHYEGMYSFANLLGLADVVTGASFRRYALTTGGTLFAQKEDGSEYTMNELGAYVQATKDLSIDDVVIKPTIVIRYDKNQYLKGQLTPRLSVAASVGKHHFRASWQTAFHNPTPEQLFSVPPVGLSGQVGGLPLAYNRAGLNTNLGYLQSDVVNYQDNPQAASTPLPVALIDPIKFTVEKLRTWEVGYRTLIKNKLSIDAFIFRSYYTDLIDIQTYYQLLTPGVSTTALLSSTNYRTLQVYTNSPNEIFVNGAGISAEYGLGDGYTLKGNYVYQMGYITLRNAQGNIRNDLSGEPINKRKITNPEVVQLGRNYFNTPQNRYNITLSNPRIGERLGASITYHWTDKMWYEQGITAGDIWLPSWTSLDAQLSYKLPRMKSIIKVGGTNLLNQYYAQGYGLARIGGMYSVSLNFDELMR